MCNCKLCKRGKKFSKIVNGLDKKDKDFLEQIYESFMCAEEELEVLQARCDGAWPSSVEFLRCALANAMQIRKQKGEPMTKDSVFRVVADSEIIKQG
jgi:hypothetical protein